MEISNEIYLNCGIYDDGKNPIELFIVEDYYFASSAWCISDEAYNEISGRKFSAITSSDNKSWDLERYNIRRISEKDNVEEILSRANAEFVQRFNERFCI